MKPLNFDNSPCSPTSSNCVIWSGPDLPCISLCQGDSITDVVEKLATELCTILDTLNINSYDLDCFNLVNCAPQTFTDLINFLIVKVCELENIPATSCSTGSSGCPTDCIVSVAPCFVVNGQTTMNLTDYVTAIGEKICAIIDVNNLQDIAITNLDDRVTILENTPPPVYTTPTMIMECTVFTLPEGSTQGIDTVIRTFINEVWCPYVDATGTAGDLVAAVASQCIANTDMSLAYPTQTMSAAYPLTWQSVPETVADTIENIWVAICDIRSAFDSITTTVVEAGDGIDVTSTTVGNTVTYTVSTLGALRAQGTPSNLDKVTPGADVNLYFNIGGSGAQAVKQLMTEIYDDDNAYDPTTGIWTCPATGRYDLNFYVHLSNPDDGFTSGMFIAGIVSPSASGYYVCSSMTLNQVTRHIDITGSVLALNLNVGTQLQLNIINLSNVDYTSFGGDVARLSVQRVR